jgi:hypothetical protein
MAMLVVGGVIAALALAGPAAPSGSVHRLVPAATTLDTTPATTPALVTAPSGQAPAPATAAAQGGTTTTTTTTTSAPQPQPAIGGPAHGVCTSPTGFCSY